MKLTFFVDLTGWAEDDSVVMAARLGALIDHELKGLAHWELLEVENG